MSRELQYYHRRAAGFAAQGLNSRGTRKSGTAELTHRINPQRNPPLPALTG